VDGGVGMARAWGWCPRDATGRELPEGGGTLVDLATLQHGVAPDVALVALCDVRHALTGPAGAVVFAPQKGAAADAVERLGRGLDRLAVVTGEDGPDGLARRPGTGAAGGLGYGLAWFGGATLVEGGPWVLRRLGFDEHLAEANAVLVCEAAFDRTSLEGKLAGIVLARARARGIPAALVAPTATDVPAGVAVETGGGVWGADDVAARVARAARLLAR
jgi:glycerate kinase